MRRLLSATFVVTLFAAIAAVTPSADSAPKAISQLRETAGVEVAVPPAGAPVRVAVADPAQAKPARGPHRRNLCVPINTPGEVGKWECIARRNTTRSSPAVWSHIACVDRRDAEDNALERCGWGCVVMDCWRHRASTQRFFK